MRSWIVVMAVLGACAEQSRTEPRAIEPHETHETRACPDIALPRDATPELRAVASVLSALFESFRRSQIDRDAVAELAYPEVAPEKIEAFTHASLCVRRIVRSDLSTFTPTVDVEVSSPEAGHTMRLALEHDGRWRLNLARAADVYDEIRRMRVAEQVIASHPGARVEHRHSMGLDTTWLRSDERNVMCLTGPQHMDEGPTATLCFETPWDEMPSAAFQADAHVCVRAEPAHVWIAWPSGATFEGSCDQSEPSQRASSLLARTAALGDLVRIHGLDRVRSFDAETFAISGRYRDQLCVRDGDDFRCLTSLRETWTGDTTWPSAMSARGRAERWTAWTRVRHDEPGAEMSARDFAALVTVQRGDTITLHGVIPLGHGNEEREELGIARFRWQRWARFREVTRVGEGGCAVVGGGLAHAVSSRDRVSAGATRRFPWDTIAPERIDGRDPSTLYDVDSIGDVAGAWLPERDGGFRRVAECGR